LVSLDEALPVLELARRALVKSLLTLTESRGLDASDALAVALCHGHRVHQGPTGKFKNWKSFVEANQDRIIE
ncbi:MAG: hypothetical protein AAFX41_17025, partial [Bacteroidota bacterium]